MDKKIEISMLWQIYGALLTEKQKEYIDYYYNEDLSLAEIAQNDGITRQGVRDIIKKGEKKLFEYEEKLLFINSKASTANNFFLEFSSISRTSILSVFMLFNISSLLFSSIRSVFS